MAAARAGQTCRQVAATFKVSVASVVKWSQQFRATGRRSLLPRGLYLAGGAGLDSRRPRVSWQHG